MVVLCDGSMNANGDTQRCFRNVIEEEKGKSCFKPHIQQYVNGVVCLPELLQECVNSRVCLLEVVALFVLLILRNILRYLLIIGLKKKWNLFPINN